MRLFHLSDDPAIARFLPRASAYTDLPVVWAIAEKRLGNYLLPRDCPRVCFCAGPQSRAEDVARLLGGDRHVVAVEAAWMERVEAGRLHRYAMPAAAFALHDEGAGYWVSREPVTPLGMDTVEDLPGAIAAQGASLRVLPSLWALHDAVAASSLVFSMIRMRNAGARP